MSWWVRAQGITEAEFRAMSHSERLQIIFRYWDAVNDGWEPPVPREQWVGPNRPFDRD